MWPGTGAHAVNLWGKGGGGGTSDYPEGYVCSGRKLLKNVSVTNNKHNRGPELKSIVEQESNFRGRIKT